MDVNKPQRVNFINDQRGRDSSDFAQNKDNTKDQNLAQYSSSWLKDEAVNLAGALSNSLSLEAQNILTTLALEMEPLRVEIDRLTQRENYYREMAVKHSFLPISNRREFLRLMQHVIDHIGNLQPLPVLLIINISNAAQFRLRYGRRAADLLLCHTATSLLAVFDAGDVVGSLGGEDFGGIVLTRGPAEAITQRVDDIVQKLSDVPFSWLDNEHELRVLVGWTELDQNISVQDALDIADRSLRASDRMQ